MAWHDDEAQKEFVRVEALYLESVKKEQAAYREMQRAIGVYDRARHQAVQHLVMFNNVLKAQSEK